MKRLLLALLAANALPTALNAVEINCNSPVWKNKPQCRDESERILAAKFLKFIIY